MAKWSLITNKPVLREIFKDPPILSYRQGRPLIACSRLLVSEDDRKSERATSGISCQQDPGAKRRGPPVSLLDPARRPPAVSIVHTDREPGTGQVVKRYTRRSQTLKVNGNTIGPTRVVLGLSILFTIIQWKLKKAQIMLHLAKVRQFTRSLTHSLIFSLACSLTDLTHSSIFFSFSDPMSSSS